MTAQILPESSDVQLLISDGVASTLTGHVAPNATSRISRFNLTGLSSDTEYTYQVQIDGTLRGPAGRFRTAPPAGSPASFTIALCGDANTNSNHVSFDRVRASDPLMVWHLGDIHYENIATNNPALFRAAFDRVFRCSRQAELYRGVPTVYMPDDHDIGPNNADGTSASIPAATTVYRERVPSYSLVDSVGLWHTFDIGSRVRVIVTDGRSHASPRANTDNSSKTMLGASQKAWFKNLLSSSPGMLIVWICPRTLGGVATAGADHWGGFTTERNELGAHIAANCPGRIIAVHADAHALAIDDGSNHTYGGAAIPTFLCATLDQTTDVTPYGSATYSEGWINTNGTFGLMHITDSGGTIGIEWEGYDSTGALVLSHSFSVTP